MDRLLLAGALVAIALAVAFLVQRRRGDAGPSVPRAELPGRIDAELLALAGVTPGRTAIVVFTEETCRTCAAALDAATAAAGGEVPVVKVPFGTQADIHRAHGIDTVPTTVVVNRSGNVIDGWVGTVVPAQLAAAVAEARA